MDDFVRIVVVPVCIMVSGFLLELLAVQARGVQKGPRKFTAWLRRRDNSLHSDSPCSITDIDRLVRNDRESLVDITELASFEVYAGISFDLSIAALTADIIAVFGGQDGGSVKPSQITLTFAIHFLLLVIIVLLVTTNHRTVVDWSDVSQQSASRQWYQRIWSSWWQSTSGRRTVLAILLGSIALVSGFIMLWESL